MRETETAIVAEINCDVKWNEWEKQVNAQIKSGLTVKEWCRQNRVNEKTYYYHLRKVREKLCEDHSQQIVPISAPEPVKSSEIHIEKNGLNITLPSDISGETLAALVRELC